MGESLKWRRGRIFAPALAAILASCSLHAGFFADDYVHLYRLAQAQGFTEALGIFTFADGDAARTSTLVYDGLLPWFTHPELKLDFFRPLSALTMYLDTLLWPSQPWLFHLHSALWYACLAFAAAAVYRRILPLKIAFLAALLFAVDEGHLLPAGWWANRNALIAGAAGLLALREHILWRESGLRRHLPLSLIAYAVALLAAESALGAAAYIAAYEILGRRDPLHRKLAGIAPAAILTGCYLVAYKFLGYGVAASASYLDPFTQPGAFLAAAPGRVLSLLAAQFLMHQQPLMGDPHWAAGVILALLAILLAFLLRGSNTPQARTACWLAAGMAGAMLPLLASHPDQRLLVLPSFGGAALLAMLAALAWRHAASGWRKASLRVVAVAVIAAHGLLATLLWPAGAWFATQWNEAVETAARSADGLTPGAHTIVLNSPDPMLAFYLPYVRRQLGLPLPESWHPLALGRYEIAAEWDAAGALALAFLDRPLLSGGFEHLFRPRNAAAPQSTAVAGGEITPFATTQDGRVKELHFAPHDNVRWLYWDGQQFRLLDTREPLKLEKPPPWPL